MLSVQSLMVRLLCIFNLLTTVHSFKSKFLANSKVRGVFMTTVPTSSPVTSVLPELVVFDLDQCLWTPEMYTLTDIPEKVQVGQLGEYGEGAVGAWSGSDQIKLFPAAREVLQDYYLGKYPGMRIAAASSADTPLAVRIGRKAMTLLEVLPGVTVREVFAKGWPEGFEGNMQIGRTPPLSSDKSTTHFPILQEATGIAYDKMLFFDDCLWGDHCGKVAARCPGVVTVRTPRGLQKLDWMDGLTSYEQRNS